MENNEHEERNEKTRPDSCGCPTPHRRKFEFKVDAEPLTAWSEGDTAELTVREILDMSGNQPPEDYYLVELKGEGHKERVKHEKLEDGLRVHEHARFAAVYKGCTPVS